MLLPQRMPIWIALVVFSLVCLLSTLDEAPSDRRNFEMKWCIALSSISLVISFLASLANTSEGIRDKFVATKIEGTFIFLSVTVWILAVPVLMGPNQGLAVNQNTIVDANLYFSSWLAFCCSLAMLGSFGRDRLDKGYLTKHWLCLFISSMITMTAALRMFRDNQDCSQKENEICSELRMGIALSIVSAAIASVILIFAFFVTNKNLSGVLLLVASILILALWVVLVVFLTFKNGPGSKVGTLFFGTWISCILALFLAVSYIHMVASSPSSTSTTSDTSSNQKERAGRAYEGQSKV